LNNPISDFEEYWERLPEHLHTVIEEAVKNHHDVAPLIIPAKDGEIMAYINPIGDRDQYLKILRLVIQGMEPDEIMFVTDGYVAHQQNKHDGTPWQRGEMSKAYLDMTEDADLVSENVNIIRMDRLGNVSSISQDYRRNDDDTAQFEDQRLYGAENETKLEGYVVEELRKAFSKETYRQWAKRNDVDFLPDEELSEADFSLYMCSMVIKQALIPLGCSALLMVRGADNSEKVYEYFKHGEESGDYKVMTPDEYKAWIGEDEERE
jgi:hypothetical protein